MGLDIYVGSLTRYFARDWKTIVQQLAERGELPAVQVVRSDDGPPADKQEIRPAVLEWRAGLSEALKDELPSALAWDESDDAPYFTDKPAWDCYGALLLWAAYAEHPNLTRPETNPVKSGPPDWLDDPAFTRSTAEGAKSRYGQLLRHVEIWLPADFALTFGAPWLTGNPCYFGSSTQLLLELDALNKATWNAPLAELDRWRRDLGDFGSSLEDGAKFAFSILRALASEAVDHRLPMLLDY